MIVALLGKQPLTLFSAGRQETEKRLTVLDSKEKKTINEELTTSKCFTSTGQNDFPFSINQLFVTKAVFKPSALMH